MREDVYEWSIHTFNERDSYITKGVGYKWVLNNIAKNEKRWPEEYVAAKLAYDLDSV